MSIALWCSKHWGLGLCYRFVRGMNFNRIIMSNWICFLDGGISLSKAVNSLLALHLLQLLVNREKQIKLYSYQIVCTVVLTWKCLACNSASFCLINWSKFLRSSALCSVCNSVSNAFTGDLSEGLGRNGRFSRTLASVALKMASCFSRSISFRRSLSSLALCSSPCWNNWNRDLMYELANEVNFYCFTLWWTDGFRGYRAFLVVVCGFRGFLKLLVPAFTTAVVDDFWLTVSTLWVVFLCKMIGMPWWATVFRGFFKDKDDVGLGLDTVEGRNGLMFREPTLFLKAAILLVAIGLLKIKWSIFGCQI
jgi:hypothetical protein